MSFGILLSSVLISDLTSVLNIVEFIAGDAGGVSGCIEAAPGGGFMPKWPGSRLPRPKGWPKFPGPALPRPGGGIVGYEE